MSIINKLATFLNRRDEVPNQELAKKIVAENNRAAVIELIENLNNQRKDIQNDCIKVVYEIGEIKPSLIAGYAKEFIRLLDSKNNRMQWGAMSALNRITAEDPKIIYGNLGKIISAADKGTVITRDNAVAILIKLGAIQQYAGAALSLLKEQMLSCPTNQLAMYAENAMPVINEKNKNIFAITLRSRLGNIEKETLRKRVEKVIKKLV